MEVVDYKDLYFIDIYKEWKSGFFGGIRRCTLDGKKYVCKTFYNDKYLEEKKEKLNLLSEIKQAELYVPKFWVKNDGNIKRYLCEYIEGLELYYLKSEHLEKTIKIIKNAKDIIQLMHQEGIIHSDLSILNIMYKANNKSVILDFDNSTYKGFLTNIEHARDSSKQYIKKFGINQELDIFNFNLLTFEIINQLNPTSVLEEIKSKRYGLFDDQDSIKICNSLLLDDKFPNKDFLIDTIDETSFTR